MIALFATWNCGRWGFTAAANDNFELETVDATASASTMGFAVAPPEVLTVFSESQLRIAPRQLLEFDLKRKFRQQVEE